MKVLLQVAVKQQTAADFNKEKMSARTLFVREYHIPCETNVFLLNEAASSTNSSHIKI